MYGIDLCSWKQTLNLAIIGVVEGGHWAMTSLLNLTTYVNST